MSQLLSCIFSVDLFLTTHCNIFCTWKSPTIPTFFYTNNPYFFTTFPKFLSLLFVEGRLKDWGGGGLKIRGVICISMWLVGGGGGVDINFGFPAGGSCFNCPYKIIKFFPCSLVFYKLNSYQAT